MNCIITGASRGLGKAMAERFAAAGYGLYLVARDAGRLAATQEELSAVHPGLPIHVQTVDMGEKEEVETDRVLNVPTSSTLLRAPSPGAEDSGCQVR